MLNVPVVMLVAAAVVLAGVVYVATGRGGELAFFAADYAPVKMDEVTSTDVALFRPPTVLWGYSMQATDEALSRIANAITERDIEISALQQQVADLEAGTARRRGHAGPADAAPREGRPARWRRERPAPPPEPDVIGSAADDPDIVLPNLATQRGEPRRSGRDAPPPEERPERDGTGDRDIWGPVTRAGRPGEPGLAGPPEGEPGQAGAPPTSPWIRRTPAGDASTAEWASLPKRSQPPSGPSGPAGDDEEDGR